MRDGDEEARATVTLVPPVLPTPLRLRVCGPDFPQDSCVAGR